MQSWDYRTYPKAVKLRHGAPLQLLLQAAAAMTGCPVIAIRPVHAWPRAGERRSTSPRCIRDGGADAGTIPGMTAAIDHGLQYGWRGGGMDYGKKDAGNGSCAAI